jgi:hypothetical protein
MSSGCAPRTGSFGSGRRLSGKGEKQPSESWPSEAPPMTDLNIKARIAAAQDRIKRFDFTARLGNRNRCGSSTRHGASLPPPNKNSPISSRLTKRKFKMDNSYQGNMTALAGGSQTGATPISRTFSRFVTVVTAGDSCVLPNAAPGLQYTIKNAAASNSMNVFASLTSSPPMYGILDSINGASNSTAFAIAAGKSAKFFCVQLGVWDTLLSA